MPRGRAKQPKSVETLTHDEARRSNLPSAEHQPLMREEEQSAVRVAYERRSRDLDPQLVWRGKDEQDSADLEVNVPPLYIQERVHPKVLVDDLMRQTAKRRESESESRQQGFADLFADFNGLPSEDAKTEFYQHDANWSNRMILGDSLQVMASLAEREGLRGKVQCIYVDPPYGIRFGSNFQWSTTSNVVRDRIEHVTREPEQVKAFRDTWRDGIHSYLTYLRERLTLARDLLSPSGSIFVQIGDENVHLARSLLDEVFGSTNFVSQIAFRTKIPLNPRYVGNLVDHLLMYARDFESLKFRRIFSRRDIDNSSFRYAETQLGQVVTASDDSNGVLDGRRLASLDLMASGYTESCHFDFSLEGRRFSPRRTNSWKTTPAGMNRLVKANRLHLFGRTPRYKQFFDDYPVMELPNFWSDTQGASGKTFVVQTATKVIERCILMTTDPGDLVLDPTCGSGTTAYVAEQWGRRWITIDTSRVALALARTRVMGARYPYYLLADSPDGQLKEADRSHRAPSEMPTDGDIRQGFVYERVPHVTIGSIANNAGIDVIWEAAQEDMDPLRVKLNRVLGASWEEWEIPRDADETWPDEVRSLHAQWWDRRIARQKKIDASIAANADYEYLYDKPYEDRGKVRVAGPFTVESISPHRVLGVDENGDIVAESSNGYGSEYDFAQVILANLSTSGVQQAHREDRIEFTSVAPWPGRLVCAEGRYLEGGEEEGIERRAAIFIGPEFGTVSRPDLVEAAREAADGGFDVLIACAFNYEAHTTEFESLGRVPVLKARMNADLHMAEDLKNTGKGNLFVIFGEPDIDILDADDGQIQVKVNGVDVFHPNTGEVRSDGPDGIACWFIDTDYNEEAFFVRHAYFLGASDPYKSLETTLKAEIDADAWATLHSDTSRPFDKPDSGRIAVKVINHLGDEVLKVFRVG